MQKKYSTLYFQCTILRQVVVVMGAGIGKSVTVARLGSIVSENGKISKFGDTLYPSSFWTGELFE
jgi:hypothetical protein